MNKGGAGAKSGARSVVVRLLARGAGRHRLRVLLCHDEALAKEARLCEASAIECS